MADTEEIPPTLELLVEVANYMAARGLLPEPSPEELAELESALLADDEQDRQEQLQQGRSDAREAGATETSLLQSTEDPINLHDTVYQAFEQDPEKALLLLHSGTGMGGFQQLHDLMRGSSQDQAADIAATAEELRSRARSINDSLLGVVREYVQTRNPLDPLLTCAACGMREFSAQGQHVRRPLSAVGVLRFHEDNAHDNAVATRIASAGPEFEAIFTSYLAPDGQRYHLHAAFVDPPGTEDVPELSTILCGTCDHAVCGAKPSRPPLSVAAGVDFGDLARVAYGRARR
jgi:hypothetical protein